MHISAGDLFLRAGTQHPLSELGGKISNFIAALTRQMEQKDIHLDLLREHLPVLAFTMDAGRDNPLYNVLRFKGYSFSGAHVNLQTDPRSGISGNARVGALHLEKLLLDTIETKLFQDSTGVQLAGFVKNEKKKNAAVMAQAFVDKGYKICTGGTENHCMLIDLRTKFPELTGKVAENALVAADITVNKNMVPYDDRSAFQTSGLRVGTPAITTRGAKEELMPVIVDLIDTVLQTLASGWYKNGTEVIFSCGGSIFDSITAAASANDAAVIGVDVDQSYTSDTVITSALKGIGAAAQQALTAAYGSDWANYGGKLTTLGAAEGAVGLPTDTWSLKNLHREVKRESVSVIQLKCIFSGKFFLSVLCHPGFQLCQNTQALINRLVKFIFLLSEYIEDKVFLLLYHIFLCSRRYASNILLRINTFFPIL